MDSAFEKIEKEVIEREYEADLLRIRIFRKLGVILDEEKIQKETEKQPLTYRVIAEVALSEYRNHDHPLLQPYLPAEIAAIIPWSISFGIYVQQENPQMYPLTIYPFRRRCSVFEKVAV